MRKLGKIQYNAPVTLTFALLSLGALLLGKVTNGWSTVHLFSVYRAPLADPLFWVRLLTHVLGHANYTHYMGNILMLLVIGPPLEEKYGSLFMGLSIGVTALVSGLVQCLFSDTMLLGASGIVFMMIVLASLSGMKEGRIPLTLILVLVLYLGGEVMDGLFEEDNVSQLTHIVGGLCGAALGFWFQRKKRTAPVSEQPETTE